MPYGIVFQSLIETNCTKLCKRTNNLIKAGAPVTQSLSLMPCSWNTLEIDICITFISHVLFRYNLFLQGVHCLGLQLIFFTFSSSNKSGLRTSYEKCFIGYLLVVTTVGKMKASPEQLRRERQILYSLLPYLDFNIHLILTHDYIFRSTCPLNQRVQPMKSRSHITGHHDH